MKLRSFFLVLGIAVSPLISHTQVAKVNYKIQFNQETNLFDCYMIAKEGNASSELQRTHHSAQLSLVIPKGSKVSVVQNHMPLKNNTNYEGKDAISWVIKNSGNVIEANPYTDFVTVGASSTSSAHYNNINEGAEVKLFSLSIAPNTDCGSSVRISEKGLDPIAKGELSNTFSLGSKDDLYYENERAISTEPSLVKSVKATADKGKLTLSTDVTLNETYAPYSYLWSGPNDFKAYCKEPVIYNPTFINDGSYVLEVSDSRGCKQIKNVVARVNGVNMGTEREDTETPIIEAVVNVYPSSASDFFNLDVQAKDGSSISMELLDASGNAVLSKSYDLKLKNNHINETFNLTDIGPGLYNAAVTIDGEVQTRQIMVFK